MQCFFYLMSLPDSMCKQYVPKMNNTTTDRAPISLLNHGFEADIF